MSNIFESDDFKCLFPTLKKRLTRELELLINLKICDKENISISFDETNNKNIDRYINLTLYNNEDSRLYEFKFPRCYPFSPPKLNINFKPYNSYLSFYSNDFKNELYRQKKIYCFCCSTKLCGENWRPQCNMKHLMDEVNQYHKICREIADNIIIKVIKRKYLIDDINIISWLY